MVKKNVGETIQLIGWGSHFGLLPCRTLWVSKQGLNSSKIMERVNGLQYARCLVVLLHPMLDYLLEPDLALYIGLRSGTMYQKAVGSPNVDPVATTTISTPLETAALDEWNER